MQKVVGSSPIIRSRDPPETAGSFLLGNRKGCRLRGTNCPFAATVGADARSVALLVLVVGCAAFAGAAGAQSSAGSRGLHEARGARARRGGVRALLHPRRREEAEGARRKMGLRGNQDRERGLRRFRSGDRRCRSPGRPSELRSRSREGRFPDHLRADRAADGSTRSGRSSASSRDCAPLRPRTP